MSHHNKQHTRSTKGYSTLIGTVCFTIIKLLLLSVLAWIILSVYLGIQIILTGSDTVASKIQTIISTQLNTLIHQPVLLKNMMLDLKWVHIHASAYFNENMMTVLMGSFEIIVIRLTIFIFYLPLTGLQLFIFIVDGLVQRDIRKFQAAKESSFLFHRLQALGGFSMSFLFLIYLMLPKPFQPEWVLVSMSILLGLLISFSIRHFKKYL